MLTPEKQELSCDDLSNVYAVNTSGSIEWQIKNVPPEGNSKYRCAPIVSLDIDAKGDLFVTDFMGRKFQVDQKTGALTKKKIVK